MNKKERSLIRFKAWEGRLCCPVCQGVLGLTPNNELACPNGHNFDVAKQGYVNLVTRHVQTMYDRALFQARRTVIQNSGLYDELHQTLIKIINHNIKKASTVPLYIVDLGSGEGSHLDKVLQELDNAVGVGLDLSKEGIQEATKHEETPAVWLAADLAQAPLATDAVDVALTVLSPSNYEEMKRIMAPRGLALKVVPNAGYLQELRDFFHPDDEERYDNTDTVSRFREAFPDGEAIQINVTKQLSREMKKLLCRMTPLSWHESEEKIAAFADAGPDSITIDLTILTGKGPR